MPDLSHLADSCVVAPCSAACPVQTDTRGYADAVARGDYEAALDLLLEANPFSSVCGRICHHPCEQACRRGDVDEAVSLRALKRFIIENTGQYRARRREKAPVTYAERIAVVGSGPAGLTAAGDLARAGYRVSAFERSAEPGGMLGATIPRYRLPHEVVRQDIEDILSLGVELRTGVEIGRDRTLDDLRHEGFGAILLATGLSESHTLAIPGVDSEGVLLAMPFLRAARLGAPPEIGDRVVVIGGGNVAFDVARTARRLGASEVTCASLESRDELPAHSWEIAEAVEEGVRLMPSWGPKAILERDGRVSGIEFKRCTRVFDAEGRFAPQFDPSMTTVLDVDTIIIAIGQRADLSAIENSAVETERPGRLRYSPKTMTTSEPGVFACGEVAAGPGSAVEAVAEGHRAAKAIDHFLRTGELLEQEHAAPPTLKDLPEDLLAKLRRASRTEVRHVAPVARVHDFLEFEVGLSETEAIREAQRCLSCTAGAQPDEARCAGCLTCVRVCPYGVATVDRTAAMSADLCQACGLCAAECPAAAIAVPRFGTNTMRERLADVLGRVPVAAARRPLLVSYGCMFAARTREYLQQEPMEILETGIVRMTVPCVARLSVPDLLAPFELGADGALVISCETNNCPHPTAEQQLSHRIRRAKAFLDEIGVGGEHLDHWVTRESAEVSWKAFWEISRLKHQLVVAEKAAG